MADQRVRVANGRARRPWRAAPRLLEAIEQVMLIAALAAFFSANPPLRPGPGLLVATGEALSVVLILRRWPTERISRSPGDWALALAGAFGGLLMRPGGTPLAPPMFAQGLILAGALIEIAAKLSLGRRFGLAPANRGVQRGGAYRLVRHPMYLGYLLLQTGYLLLNPSLANLAVWQVVWACQLGRMFREEKLLLEDPAYRDYAERVRFRLAPWLF